MPNIVTIQTELFFGVNFNQILNKKHLWEPYCSIPKQTKVSRLPPWQAQNWGGLSNTWSILWSAYWRRQTEATYVFWKLPLLFYVLRFFDFLWLKSFDKIFFERTHLAHTHANTWTHKDKVLMISHIQATSFRPKCLHSYSIKLMIISRDLKYDRTLFSKWSFL